MKILFCEFFNMKILLQLEQNKTAWKILKANKIKRNIKATKPKIKEKLKTKCLHARQPQKKKFTNSTCTAVFSVALCRTSMSSQLIFQLKKLNEI